MIPLFPIMVSLASIMIPLAWCRPWPGVPTDLSRKPPHCSADSQTGLSGTNSLSGTNIDNSRLLMC